MPDPGLRLLDDRAVNAHLRRIAPPERGVRLEQAPVLTIFGEKNDPFGFQERIDEMFSNHQGLIVEGGNHFPMMDDPDLFATTLTRWHAEQVA